jgi:hypothetical protein
LCQQLEASFIRDLQTHIESGPKSTLDYAIFHRFDGVRHENSRYYLAKLGSPFAKLRVNGDVEGFREFAASFEADALSWNGWTASERAALQVFLARLRQLVPAADTDVSHYGYALANRALHATETVDSAKTQTTIELGYEGQL